MEKEGIDLKDNLPKNRGNCSKNEEDGCEWEHDGAYESKVNDNSKSDEKKNSAERNIFYM